MPNYRSLVLFSGGMDSTISLYRALQTGPVDVLTFHYQQKHALEIMQAKVIVDLARRQGYEIRHFQIVLLEHLPKVGSLMDPKIPVCKYPNKEITGEDPSFIPYRNLVFLSIAAQWADYWGNTEIVTGLRGGFSDCTDTFEKLVEAVLRLCQPGKAPTIISYCHKSRHNCLKDAWFIKGCWDALAYTMTCFEGTEPPCLHCLPCRKRAEGFAQLGQPDPLMQRLGGIGL